MITYNPGDVVFCKFPLRQDPLQFTPRPALIMKVLDGGKSYKMAQITSTDRSDKLVGVWLKQHSPEGREMRLRTDSFINLSNILEVPGLAIQKFMGTCPLFQSLERICKERGIKY